MTRRNRLADTTVRAAVRKGQPRWRPDGAGLYLHVVSKTAAHWVYRYQLGGRERYAGLGSADDITLADVREEHARLRALRRKGIDPVDKLRAERAEEAGKRKAAEATPPKTLTAAAEAFHAAKAPSWSKGWAARCKGIIRLHIVPRLGNRVIADITTDDIEACLKIIGERQTPTAKHARIILEQIFAFATSKKWRTGPNPAAWRNNLKDLLSKPSKIHKTRNRPALPYTEIHVFMATLRTLDTVTARALEFAILTGGRTSEILGARWSEINLDDKTWTIPDERMKANREHVVPLSNAALAILEKMKALRQSDMIFPGKTAPAVNKDGLRLLVRDLHPIIVPHGFRSTFRDWAGDETNYAREVAEAALAHKVGDATEQAYRRLKALAKRRKMMQAWADWCSRPSGQVLNMKRDKRQRAVEPANTNLAAQLDAALALGAPRSSQDTINLSVSKSISKIRA
jgi:integrase